MVNKDKLSVIICTKNRTEDTVECIESILIQTRLPDEIVIIDSSDTEELKSKLDLLINSTEITFKYIHAEAHLTKARNIGIDNSIGDIIMFLDDDDILDKDYIKEIIHIFDGSLERKLGGVSGKVLAPNFERQNHTFIQLIRGYCSHIFGTIFFLFKYGDGKFQPSGYSTFVRRDVNKVTLVECLSGANMTFRREVIREFRFDEITPYGDDEDIAYRVSRKYQNIYVPQAKVIHKASLHGGCGYRPLRMKQEIESYYHNFKKNIPQTPMHKFAFWWSVVGLFVMAMIKRNNDKLKGLRDGVINIKQNKKKINKMEGS